jgi:hypothetical protein
MRKGQGPATPSDPARHRVSPSRVLHGRVRACIASLNPEPASLLAHLLIARSRIGGWSPSTNASTDRGRRRAAVVNSRAPTANQLSATSTARPRSIESTRTEPDGEFELHTCTARTSDRYRKFRATTHLYVHLYLHHHSSRHVPGRSANRTYHHRPAGRSIGY